MAMATPSMPSVNPLNPTLYSLLEHKFGSVHVANPGAPAQIRRFRDPTRPGRVITQAASWGEYYCVCCPFCNDVGHKLWINHTYGVDYDAKTGRRTDTYLACCYKNSCLQKPGKFEQLEQMIFGPGRPVIKRAAIRVVEPVPESTELNLPGTIVRIDELPHTHRAVEYVVGRGFDPQQLASVFNVGVCVEASFRYRIMTGRIFIPSYFNKKLVAWQGRMTRDAAKGEIKYYTQGSKSRALYNYDVACTQPFVVLVEGAPSVWRLGVTGVCLFGKTLSHWQANTVGTTWAGKPVFVMLDCDARKELETATAQLSQHNVAVIPVLLPDARDPADYSQPELRSLLSAAAHSAGVPVDLSYLGGS